MNTVPRFALLFVVVIDVMGQGLIFPIVNTILTDPEQDFLPTDTSTRTREFYYGLVMGVTIALFTLASGIVSLIGGALMSVDIRLPFVISIGGFLVSIALILTVWRSADVRHLEEVPE